MGETLRRGWTAVRAPIASLRDCKNVCWRSSIPSSQSCTMRLSAFSRAVLDGWYLNVAGGCMLQTRSCGRSNPASSINSNRVSIFLTRTNSVLPRSCTPSLRILRPLRAAAPMPLRPEGTTDMYACDCTRSRNERDLSPASTLCMFSSVHAF